MDNLVHLCYLGFCVVVFCLGITMIMTADKEITKMHNELYEIVTENAMVGVR